MAMASVGTGARPLLLLGWPIAHLSHQPNQVLRTGPNFLLDSLLCKEGSKNYMHTCYAGVASQRHVCKCGANNSQGFKLSAIPSYL